MNIDNKKKSLIERKHVKYFKTNGHKIWESRVYKLHKKLLVFISKKNKLHKKFCWRIFIYS